jgi:hypothetical protein
MNGGSRKCDPTLRSTKCERQELDPEDESSEAPAKPLSPLEAQFQAFSNEVHDDLGAESVDSSASRSRNIGRFFSGSSSHSRKDKRAETLQSHRSESRKGLLGANFDLADDDEDSYDDKSNFDETNRRGWFGKKAESTCQGETDRLSPSEHRRRGWFHT